jgi:hypothetical protein
MYRTVDFHIKSPAQVSRQIQLAAASGFPVRRVFIADGDALILPTARLLAILQELRAAFPPLPRVAA